jgi:hypothetical protein
MIVALPERLDLSEIRRLDRDFDEFRRFRREPCQRVRLSRDSCLSILNSAPALDRSW